MTGWGVSGSNSVTVGIFQPANMARKFDGGGLHSQTETKIGCARFASVAGCIDFAFYSPVPKSSWHEHPGHSAQIFVGAFFSQIFSIDEHQVRRTIVGGSGVRERFIDALIGILKLNVLAHHSNADAFLRIDDAFDEFSPIAHVRLAGLEIQDPADVFIEPFGLQVEGRFVDGILDITCFDDRFDRDVAIERQFLPNFRVDRHLGAAKDHLRLQADLPQLGDALLSRLGLEFAGGLDERNQCHVHDEHVADPSLELKLSNGLQKRQSFNVTGGSADFRDEDIGFGGCLDRADPILDFIGDVRNYLDGLAEIITTALVRENGLVDLATGDVVGPREHAICETLVVSKIKIGLRSIGQHIDFTMLEGVHRAWIDIQIRVELL